MRLLSWLVLSLSLLGLAGSAAAETRDFGAYTVHYIAVNSTFLNPASARRAFLNIAVLRNEQDGSTTPVPAVLSGGKRNLMQQSSVIAFQEIREGTSIYYIGQFEFSNAETLRFAVDVQPEGSGAPLPLEWTTQLYADP
jgi:hypothetical protein